MLKEFKDFLSRGNIVELATAFVFGAAFGAFFNTFVEGIITPVVGMIFSRDFSDMTFTINNSVFDYGQVINGAIQFVTIAAAIFFLVVKPMNALTSVGNKDDDEPSETGLLTEIRDLLRDDQRRTP